MHEEPQDPGPGRENAPGGGHDGGRGGLAALSPTGWMSLGAVLFLLGVGVNGVLHTSYGGVLIVAAVVCFVLSIAGNNRLDQGWR